MHGSAKKLWGICNKLSFFSLFLQNKTQKGIWSKTEKQAVRGKGH
ncbi:50S ribosomal protein L31 domain protein [Hoylesella loescheii DSM 19665 = JCM 12249 = ATCC 15930]|uniref:50S ribosomal protein L31 domain protein n=1 Tax=Hoylesella loescheii DSM 19665 = JCM 12249 = ATCC 15930 TaxID=1122985 RepID=A0A069QI37_HOYLO|nr:50S ribosomal protein L31 domain protein [Hoylesella loescheii DSM 19665 = JCM 12249 = ATCC 15930]